MNIYLINNERYDGPYSEPEVIARVKDGRVAKTDLAWCEGLGNAMPLIEILCKLSATKPIHYPQSLSTADLRLIADNYTKLLAAFAVWLVGLFVPMSASFERLWILLLAGFWIRVGWRLSVGLQRKPWPWVIWSLIPLANIYALVQILRAAAKTLKENGIVLKYLIPDQSTLTELPQQKKFDPSLN